MVFPILSLAAVSFAIAWLGTLIMRPVAGRYGFVDKPGHRKVHRHPIPLGGGVAIFWAFALPLLLVLLVVHTVTFATRPDGTPNPYVGGVMRQAPMGYGLLGAMLAMPLLGLRDDRRAMGPVVKLFLQLAIAAAFVIAFDVRALTFLDKTLGMGPTPSVVMTVLWVTATEGAGPIPSTLSRNVRARTSNVTINAAAMAN